MRLPASALECHVCPCASTHVSLILTVMATVICVAIETATPSHHAKPPTTRIPSLIPVSPHLHSHLSFHFTPLHPTTVMSVISVAAEKISLCRPQSLSQ